MSVLRTCETAPHRSRFMSFVLLVSDSIAVLSLSLLNVNFVNEEVGRVGDCSGLSAVSSLTAQHRSQYLHGADIGVGWNGRGIDLRAMCSFLRQSCSRPKHRGSIPDNLV